LEKNRPDSSGEVRRDQATALELLHKFNLPPGRHEDAATRVPLHDQV
jgi:hypothetical protein